MLYNVVLYSTVQQSESAMHIHISPPFCISFPFRSPESTELPVLNSWFSLVIYFIHGSPNVPILDPLSGDWGVYLQI